MSNWLLIPANSAVSTTVKQTALTQYGLLILRNTKPEVDRLGNSNFNAPRENERLGVGKEVEGGNTPEHNKMLREDDQGAR